MAPVMPAISGPENAVATNPVTAAPTAPAALPMTATKPMPRMMPRPSTASCAATGSFSNCLVGDEVDARLYLAEDGADESLQGALNPVY